MRTEGGGDGGDRSRLETSWAGQVSCWHPDQTRHHSTPPALLSFLNLCMIAKCHQMFPVNSAKIWIKNWPLFYGFNILEQARWELSNKLGIEREGLGPTCAGSQLIDKQYWSAGWRWHTAILLYNVRRLDARAGPMLCWLTKSFLSETFLVFWLQHISNEIKLLIMKSTRNEFGIRVISSYTWILS